MSQDSGASSSRLLSEGTDPDPRFSLANERTFLAWIRTGLALIALGVGVATFVTNELRQNLWIVVAAGLVVLGGALCAAAWFRWLRVERAMRLGRGIPPSRMAPILAFGMAILAIVSVFGVVLDR